MKRTKVVDVLQLRDFGAIVNVKGWVRTHRSSKAVDFIRLTNTFIRYISEMLSICKKDSIFL